MDELALVEPLWSGLREHHASIAPEFGPPRTREESWRRRRSQYEGWLAQPDSFALLAERDAHAVGYALVRLDGGSSTWPLADRAGELETLAVLPAERGHGTGTALLQRVRAKLSELGVSELSLQVIAGNDDAMRFYQRQGFRASAVSLRSGAEGT